MPFTLQRIYDQSATPERGKRILVDRLWPQGMSKVKAKLDGWDRELAPSGDLRKWFNHDPAKWTEFRQRYRAELRAPALAAPLRELVQAGRKGPVILLYAARDPLHNNAVVLKELLEQLTARG